MTQLSFNLAPNISYVSGTVNDKDYNFSLQSVSGAFSTWVVNVDRATPDVYRCKITAVDTLGNVTNVNTTVYYGLQLITDRTEEDVAKVKSLTSRGILDWSDEELAEYLAGLKGAYNAVDLNRVESAVEYISERFIQDGYNYPIPQIKNIWSIEEIMSIEDTQRYLSNIETMRNMIALPDDTPTVAENMENFTYTKANDLERILEVVDQHITKMEQAYMYSGDLFGGEL